MTLEQLAILVALVVQTSALVWWASGLTATVRQHDRALLDPRGAAPGRKTMKRRLLALFLVAYAGGALLALQSACIEQTNLTTTGPTGGFGSVPSSTIDNLRIEPSQFELVNGQQATAIVVGQVGGVEVRDFDFTASIGPNSTIATIVQISGNVILFKAENPGNTALRVTAGRSSAEANIRVVRADE